MTSASRTQSPCWWEVIQSSRRVPYRAGPRPWTMGVGWPTPQGGRGLPGGACRAGLAGRGVRGAGSGSRTALWPQLLGRPSILGRRHRRSVPMDSKDIEEGRRRWQERFDASRRREADFTTLSGTEVQPVYGPPADDPRFEWIGWPGEFPYTRGLYATGYRGR